MDPLTAFGLAASVVQFVTLTGGLLKKSTEIYGSASGLPNALDIHEVYRELTGISSSLQDITWTGHGPCTADRGIRRNIDSVRELANTCRRDCEKLLDVLGKLKAKDGRSHRFKSFRVAFIALREGDKIEHLEKRLAETERQIMLYLCHISNEYHSRHTQALEHLQQAATELAIKQRARLDSFASSLEQIKTIITTNFPPRVAGIEKVRDLMAKLALSERDITREQEILRSLSYEHYLDRYRFITPAHKKTFSWVFNPSNTSSEGRRLLQWFQQGQGVFWITGKPGSGKSTMMKFLCDDAQTTTALQAWACDKKLVIASHYFWLSGTLIQKSQEGLFRSLLHGIFQQCPELIQEVCPTRWTAVYSHKDHWTLNELLSAISSISNSPRLEAKFCIFVDGLDEYHGDHVEMCNTIQKLGTTTQDIKLCVASRPWNDFENAFGGGQQLVEMHHLTRDDIHNYTFARLTEHWAWTTVAANTCLADSLMKLILEHAQGVFLWVFLVTKEIRESLSNYDSLEDLYRRVESFPSDLGQFFQHILESVDPFYHAKMSTSLQITLKAPQPLQLPIYYFHDREYADPNYALKLPILEVTEEAAEQRCKIIKKRLGGWCKGLLEVPNQDHPEVQFLHRTVRDFLKTPEMAAFLKTKAPAHFSANLSIMKAYTAWMKSRIFYNKPENPNHVYDEHPGNIPSQDEAPFHWMTTGLLSTIDEDHDKQDPVSARIQMEAFRHLDEFERSVIEIENQGWMTFHDEYGKDVKCAASLFREMVFRHDLVLYLSHRITKDPGYLQLCGMVRYIEAFMKAQRPDPFYAELHKALGRVLEFGEDPNKEADPGDRSSSLFATLILGLKKHPEKYYWEKQLVHMRLVSLFLKFGANPNASFNASISNPCRLMIAIPLEIEIDGYDGNTYLLELDSLFDHGADSEAKMEVQGQGLSNTAISAREWFFGAIQFPLVDRNLNNEIIGQVALRLLRRIEDEAEADDAWKILNRALPCGIYERTQSVAAGSKRQRDMDHQEPGKRTKSCNKGHSDPQGKVGA